MRRIKHITESVTVADFKEAIIRAAKGHKNNKEVIDTLKDIDARAKELYDAYRDGTYKARLRYRKLEKTNNNGKRRKIDSPFLDTRIYQILVMLRLEPVYFAKDNGNGLNCKAGCGITAKDKRRSVLHRLKSVYYSRPDLHYALVLDQRKCYEHVTPAVFRRLLRNLVDDRAFVDFCTEVIFVDGKLPIGTPTSPLAHHVVMLPFDIMAKEMAAVSVRYADDNFMAFHTKEEAQRAKWRVKNWWWYGLGIRAKRHTARVVPLSDPLDFCGYVLHRGGGGHSRGWTSVRKGTLARARKATRRNWGSYFGILSAADAFAEMKRIENDMKLSQLTNKVKIQRKLDAPHIDLKEVCGQEITVMDYELRRDKEGKPDWVKLLLAIPTDEGVNLAREVHGGYSYLAEFLDKAEREFGGRECIVPIEGVTIENHCGYIFKDSTNQIKQF